MTREEAIEKIREAIPTLWKETKDALQTIIPELVENEDERHWKWILEYLYDGLRKADEQFKDQFKLAIAYLEKQKAKERLDRMAPIYNDKESFESALEKAWKYYNESASRTVDSFEDDYIECVFSKGFREGFLYKEKQKEQNPTEYLPKRKVYDIMNKLTELSTSTLIPVKSEEYVKIHEITSDVRSLLDYPIEQKSTEWSEEDSRILYNVIAYIGYAAGQRGVRDDEFKEANTWLKSIKNRGNFPKSNTTSPSWSEEDEKNCNRIIRFLEPHKTFFPTKETKEEMQNWIKNRLKSLRPPQYCENCKLKRSVENWKPSEEQMEHLKRCFSHGKPHLPMPNQHVLESLYNDLKKL